MKNKISQPGFTFRADFIKRLRLSGMNIQPHGGFTFIEVLVTITIIGLIASLITFNFRGSTEQARDTQRKNDLKQYQVSLENYSTSNGSLYPSRTDANGVSASTILCQDLGTFITSCPGPEDPKNGDDPATYTYRYQSDGDNTGGATALQWVLWARLERSDNYWVVCSDARTGEVAASGFSVSGGVCPL